MADGIARHRHTAGTNCSCVVVHAADERKNVALYEKDALGSESDSATLISQLRKASRTHEGAPAQN
jgi:hypothetical protein